jgi:hypothetical protein
MSELTMYPLSLEERNGILEMYSDFHKDAYGFRPRYDYPSFSDEQLNADFDRFSQVCNENRVQEDIQLQASLKAWDALVEKTIGLGANDRKTALKWLWDGSELSLFSTQDIEHFAWQQGILFCDEGKRVVAELTEMLGKELNEGMIEAHAHLV